MGCPEELRINLRLVPVKATYFFALAAVASLLPYLPIFMYQAGLSKVECGIIYGTMPFVGALARPLFGGMADKLHKHKGVLMLTIVMSAVFHALLFAIPHHQVSTRPYNSSVIPINMTCDTGSTGMTFCPHSELMRMGCVQTNDNLNNPSGESVVEYQNSSKSKVIHGKSLPDPLDGLENCNLLCRFDKRNNLNELCINYHDKQINNTPVCLIKKGDPSVIYGPFGEKFSGIHNDIKHSFDKATFQMALFVEKLTHTGNHYVITHHPNSTYSSARNICHKYYASKFDYNNITYDHNWVLTCDAKASLTCELECSKPPENLMKTPGYDCTENHKNFGTVFWMFFLIYFIAQFWFAPAFSLIDGIVYDYLGDDRGKWGRSRMFGTIGFIVFGLTSGLLMDLYEGDDGMKNYAPGFIMFPVLSIIAAITVCFYSVSGEVHCGQVFKNVLSLFKETKIVVFMVIILMFGINTGVIETFLFLHLQEIGASQLLLGLCMVMNCIPEIMFLFFAGKIMEKIGHISCFYIVFLAYILRLLLYSFLTNPWAALGIEPLHSITFGLFYAAASSYGSVVTPTGMHGTIQGLIGGIYFGIGKGIGGVTSGKIYEDYGSHIMFRVYAIITTVLLVVYAMLQFFLFRQVPTYRKSPTHEPNSGAGGAGKPLGSEGDLTSNGYNTVFEQDDSVTFRKDRELLVYKDGTFEEDGDLGIA